MTHRPQRRPPFRAGRASRPGAVLRSTFLATAFGIASLAGCTANEPPEPVAIERPAAPRAAPPSGSPESSRGERSAERPGSGDETPGDETPDEDASSEPSEAPGERAEDDSDSTVILIESGAGEKRKSLLEAAAEAREGRKNAKAPLVRITNENLHEFQDAELTFAEPSEDEDSEPGAEEDRTAAAEGDSERESTDGQGGASGAGESAEDGEEADVPLEERGEQYWRSRVLDVRRNLREAVEEERELEERVASLRRSFYAEDDPYVRDGQIKQAWDRALGRLATARHEIEQLRRELSDTLEEGRRAGALPGWLREGIELEPSFEEDEEPTDDREPGDLSVHEPEELETVEPDEPPDESP